MKKQMLTGLFIAAGICSLQAQQKFAVKGKLAGLPQEMKVMLTYSNGESRKTDSAITRKGIFEITGSIPEPCKASIELKSLQPDTGAFDIDKYYSRDVTEFFLDPGTISIKGTSLKKAVITGGKAQQDYLALQAQLQPLQDKMTPLSNEMRGYQKAKNEIAANQLIPQLRAIRMDMTKTEDNFIKTHPDSYVSLDLVKQKGAVIDLPRFEPFYNALSENMKNTVTGKALTTKLQQARKTGVGQPAINFTQNNLEGTPVSLASLKGKYVLIDFWASWCGPCRAENPNVVKAYQQFKNKNFEIIAVSLDDKKDAWAKAIEKDGLPWIHVSDLNGWKNKVAVEYGINAVPQNLLLDPNGIIIAKNLRGETLAEILGKYLN